MIEVAQAYAKLNLSLDIISKMDDGYHNIKTVMQSVSLCDEIEVKCVQGEGLSVETDLPFLPVDERNIGVKAALAFFGHTGIEGYKTSIRIMKSIPVCAGLGGGSTDGACILRMLDSMFKTELGCETLEKIAGSFGSDVPFCISGGTMLAEGRGDVLTDLPPIPDCYVVVCKPSFTCSTPELFKRVKCEKIRARPDTCGMIAALETSDLRSVAQRMYNVFEDVMPRGMRDVADIKYTLLDNGALGAAMTGSGPSVFGLFDNETYAHNAYAQLSANYYESFMAKSVGRHFDREYKN